MNQRNASMWRSTSRPTAHRWLPGESPPNRNGVFHGITVDLRRRNRDWGKRGEDFDRITSSGAVSGDAAVPTQAQSPARRHSERRRRLSDESPRNRQCDAAEPQCARERRKTEGEERNASGLPVNCRDVEWKGCGRGDRRALGRCGNRPHGKGGNRRQIRRGSTVRASWLTAAQSLQMAWHGKPLTSAPRFVQTNPTAAEVFGPS